MDNIIERAQNRWHKALFSALFEKGKILINHSNVDENYVSALQSAYKTAASNGWNNEQGNMALQLGKIFSNMSEMDIAREYFQTAKMIFEKSGITQKIEQANLELQKI